MIFRIVYVKQKQYKIIFWNERECKMKWIILWTVVWLVQVPTKPNISEYGGEQIYCTDAVMREEQKSEQKYKIFTSTDRENKKIEFYHIPFVIEREQ